MANIEQEEVLDFEDDSVIPELPDDNPFEEPKKHPWLLIGIGVVVVVLVLAVALKLTVGGRDSTDSIEIPIEEVTTPTQTTGAVSSDDFATEADKMVAVPVTDNPVTDKSIADKPAGIPEREVNVRKDVVFDPDKPIVQRPKPRPITEPAKSVEVEAPAQKAIPSARGVWTVQVGSYSTRAAAESGQRQIIASHKNLFVGRDFVILSAVLPNGVTAYRLRVVGFKTSSEAGSFCKNAGADGVSCYVTK